jgi:medium-chain acyl-[acyl-carrier-protein] hydrolase
MDKGESPIDSLEFEVRGFDCGYGGYFRAFALANFLQEAAGKSAARLGFGMDDLHAKGRTWMLSRLELRVHELPVEGERVTVRTWPAGAKKLFAMRAIEILGSGGSRGLVRAVYAYLIVDIAARRPLRPQSVFGAEFPGEGLGLPIPDYSFDIPAADDAAFRFSQTVSGRHIDHNGHANNAHIIDWLVDAASAGAVAGPRAVGLGGEELRGLRVEFANEALEGDTLEARSLRLQGASPFEGASSSYATELLRDGAKVARALVCTR